LISKSHKFLRAKNHKNLVSKATFRERMFCLKPYYTATMRKLLQDPDTFLEKNSRSFFKSHPGDTTTIGVVHLDGQAFVIKRYNLCHYISILKNCFRPSPAMRSWINSHYLQEMKIKTIEPVAILEKRLGCFYGKTYFISRYMEGVRGCDYFAQFEHNAKAKGWQRALSSIIKLLHKMEQAKISHGDFQYGNLLIDENNDPLLLDLDHMRAHRYRSWFFRHLFVKDLKRFPRFFKPHSPIKKAFEQSVEDLF
jgi:hypothetical protein